MAQHTPYVPRHCTWEVTLGCNMRCIHCGSAAGARREQELSTAEALVVADDLARLGTHRLTLSGGELLMRKDWHIIARRLLDHRISTGIITNGLLVGRQLDRFRSVPDL